MAGHKAVDLMVNDVNQGDANRWVDWPGGDGVFLAEAGSWSGGNVKLEGQSRNGTAIGISQYATTSAIQITSNNMANFRFPQGKIRVTVTSATAVYASAIQVHSVMAG